MADPIQLPDSSPKNLSTSKVTRSARQQFENRRKNRREQSRRQKPAPKDKDTSGHASQAHAKNRTRGASEDSPSGNAGHDQGKVIDIRI